MFRVKRAIYRHEDNTLRNNKSMYKRMEIIAVKPHSLIMVVSFYLMRKLEYPEKIIYHSSHWLTTLNRMRLACGGESNLQRKRWWGLIAYVGIKQTTHTIIPTTVHTSFCLPLLYSLSFTYNFQIIKILIILRELHLSFIFHLDTTVSLS